MRRQRRSDIDIFPATERSYSHINDHQKRNPTNQRSSLQTLKFSIENFAAVQNLTIVGRLFEYKIAAVREVIRRMKMYS